MPRIHVELVLQVISATAVIELVQDDAKGGVAVFLGDVRRTTGARATEHLEYEAYPEMALKVMHQICSEASEQFAANVAIVHRLGALQPGETTVVCAAACAHRAQAFECCRMLIDRLKAEVPIWKKEFGPDGEEWIGS